MGTDYYAGLAIGYRVSVRSILKRAYTRLEEKSHVEARFDQRTGARLEDVTVIDQHAGWEYRWGGETYEDDPSSLEDLWSAIAADVGAVSMTFGQDDGVDDMPTHVVFGLDVPEREEPDPNCRMSVGGSVLVDDLVKRRKEYRSVGRKLRELGFKPGRCRVFVDLTVSY